MERSRGEGLHDTQLTTLDGGRDLHGSPPLVAQVTGWGLVPVGREVAKLIPELDDSPLGWKANSHVSSEESSEASGPWTGRTPAGREDPGWRGGGPQLAGRRAPAGREGRGATDGDVLPVLRQVLPHGPQEVPVLLGVCKVLLVVCGLQDQVGHIDDPDNPAARPAGDGGRHLAHPLAKARPPPVHAEALPGSTHMPPSSCGPTFSYILIRRLQL